MLRLAFVLVALFGLAAPALARPNRAIPAQGRLTITIDLSAQSMRVVAGGRVLHMFDVSTGRRGFATPQGTYRPTRLHKTWYSSKYHGSPMPHSIFFHGGYAIHGTNEVKKLGRIASHGCVRLHPDDARRLFSLVQRMGARGTKIVIKG